MTSAASWRRVSEGYESSRKEWNPLPLQVFIHAKSSLCFLSLAFCPLYYCSVWDLRTSCDYFYVILYAHKIQLNIFRIVKRLTVYETQVASRVPLRYFTPQCRCGQWVNERSPLGFCCWELTSRYQLLCPPPVESTSKKLSGKEMSSITFLTIAVLHVIILMLQEIKIKIFLKTDLSGAVLIFVSQHPNIQIGLKMSK